ncbi:ATP-dependent RNA helicase DDX24-like [Scleropages formosus]|uniref:ATP-dependent RNA helicase n=1 Tax=Scleropages formosus TaxID=113540 RepID=A0A0P7U1Z4_SCLFO|nr:ATP-dependent RNA helicase DDX24-like [Scleropages formosus]
MKTNKFQSKKKGSMNLKKSAKRGINVRGSWKVVQLDPSLFPEEDIGELVSFEELTDYRLVDSHKVALKEDNKKKKKKKEREKKGQKRKASDGDEMEAGIQEAADDGGGEEEKEEESETPSKKKKRKMRETDDSVGNVSTVEGNGAKAKLDKKSEHSPALESSAASEKIKKKRRVKNLKEPSTESQTTSNTKVPSDSGSPAKVPLFSKRKTKNWTKVALSGSSGHETDVSAWKDLFVPEPVLDALRCLGFSSPTPIQALALPPAIRDRLDVLGAAETGSGKTLSFGIPMIHSILEWRKTQNMKPKEGTVDESVTEAVSKSESEQPASTEEIGREECGDTLDDEGSDDDEQDVPEDDMEDDDNEDINSQQLGCVKVIEDVEFDFDITGKTGDLKSQAIQKQPLLGLVLTPTRELAVQVKHHIDAAAQFTGIKTAIVVGGMAPQKQNRILKRQPEIVIATPGRLWELIKEGHPHLQNLGHLRCLVIDEADRMVEKGHFAELENLLEMLNNTQFSPNRQTFVFSATLTMVHQLPSRIWQKKKGKKQDHRSKLEILMEKVGIKAKPKIIDLTRKEATVETLTETRIHCDKDDKDFYLYYFLRQYPGRTMVFANSIDCIKRLTSLLTILDCAPLPLHANMHQKQRLKNLERFAEKESSVLLTTDVAARGLDIPNVQHVIHYQVPRTSETYVHRSGRTARASKEGLSLLLIGPDDMINFRKIYRTLGKDEDLPIFPIQVRCMAAVKERVNLARKIEKIEYHNSREKQHNSWFKQAAEELDIELDDDVLLGRGKDEAEERQQQKMIKGLKKHLQHLLQQPIFQNAMKTKYPTQMGKLTLPKLPLANVETALDSLSKQKQKQKGHKKKNQKQQQ